MFDVNSASVEFVYVLLALAFFVAVGIAALAITCRTIHKGCIKAPKTE